MFIKSVDTQIGPTTASVDIYTFHEVTPEGVVSVVNIHTSWDVATMLPSVFSVIDSKQSPLCWCARYDVYMRGADQASGRGELRNALMIDSDFYS